MKSILVCTDGSRYSEICCEYAAWLSARSGAAVNALYVTDIRQFEIPLVADLSGSMGLQPYQNVISQLQEIEKQKAAIYEEATRRIFREKGIEAIEFHHRTGLLVDQIEDLEEGGFDLILLGKRGANVDAAIEHLGSNMERVIRAVNRPCFVTSRRFQSLKKVLIAFDGGKSTSKALEFLIVTKCLHDLEFHVVSVVEDGDDEDLAKNRLLEAEKRLTAAGMRVVAKVSSGIVENVISEYVEDESIDCLVMGAYGHSRIRYLLIGSSTTAMIRACRIPVLCFR